MENHGRRWDERIFAVRLTRHVSENPILRFRFTSLGPVRIHAIVDGAFLPESEFISPGEHTYAQPIPATAVKGEHDVSIRFELDQALRPAGDRRELRVQVKVWSYDEQIPRAVSPIAI